LQELVPLLEIPGARFLSLQKALREGDEEILAAHQNIDVESIRHCADFADTAALVAGLDLVITVDTSVAHVAGALGKPVWVLLAHSAHWVWLREREASPWYPTAALFRQGQRGDWGNVIARVGQRLRERL
jgi:ADP-heptose:LPS heptosyltransferase